MSTPTTLLDFVIQAAIRVGVAIGVAVSGLLAHFAAGLFMLMPRPYKVGDFVDAGGVTGTVRELGMFHTKIDTPDNVLRRRAPRSASSNPLGRSSRSQSTAMTTTTGRCSTTATG
jgi:hypothetical protein